MSKPILTNRNELTTLAGEDWFHVVDVSDPNDDPAGSSKKISTTNIKSFIAASNTVIVNSEADLPVAVAGVITLESGKEYLINNVVITSNQFRLPSSGFVRITSNNLSNALVYIGTSDMFIGDDFFVFLTHLVLFQAPLGNFFNLSGFGSFFSINTVWQDASGAGTLANDNVATLFTQFTDIGNGFILQDNTIQVSFANSSFPDWKNNNTTFFSASGATGLLVFDGCSFAPKSNETIFNFNENLKTSSAKILINTTQFDLDFGGEIFGANSLDGSYIRSSIAANVGLADSTIKGKLRFVNNTATTTIAGAGQNTPINVNVSATIALLERILAQDIFTSNFTTDTLTVGFNHGLSLNDRVFVHAYAGATLPTGLDATIEYYVVNPTATTFQLSLTAGGGAVDFTDNGAGTLYYRHNTGVTRLLHLIYVGLEDTTISPSGWSSIVNSVNSFDDMRGVIMKINLDGTIVENEVASKLNTNNTRPLSSQTDDLIKLSTGEGIVIYVRNESATNNLIVEDLLTNIKKV